MVRKTTWITFPGLLARGYLDGVRRSQGMSRRSVADVLYAAKAAGIGWDDVANRPDDEVYALLFPGRGERGSV